MQATTCCRRSGQSSLSTHAADLLPGELLSLLHCQLWVQDCLLATQQSIVQQICGYPGAANQQAGLITQYSLKFGTERFSVLVSGWLTCALSVSRAKPFRMAGKAGGIGYSR